MAIPYMENAIRSVHKSLDQIIETAEGLSEDIIRKKPSEEEWSIMQILCHVLEVGPYWMGEIEKIKENPQIKWGRGLNDEARLEAVNTTDSRSVSEVLAGLRSLKTELAGRLEKLDEDTLQIEAESKNPNFGTKPVSFIVDHLIVEHIAKHYGQINRNLSKFHINQ